MPYGKRGWFGLIGLAGLAVILVGGQMTQAGSTPEASISSWLYVLLRFYITFVGLVVALFVLYLIVCSIGVRRRDTATRAAIEASEPEALVVYVTQTAESRKVLEALDKHFVLEWAAALAVTNTGVSLWQSTRAGRSAKLFDLQWLAIQQVRIVSLPIGRYRTGALELSFVVAPDDHLVVPFGVRPRFGSVIGLGPGPRMKGIEAKVQSLRGTK